MTSDRRGVFLVAVALISFTPNKSSCEAPADAANQSSFRQHSFKRIVGLKVENLDGQCLGKLNNFVLDLELGRAEFAILSSGGVLGVGAHMRLAPAAAVSLHTIKKKTLALDISKARWRNAPAFRKSQLASLSGRAAQQQIYQYY